MSNIASGVSRRASAASSVSAADGGSRNSSTAKLDDRRMSTSQSRKPSLSHAEQLRRGSVMPIDDEYEVKMDPESHNLELLKFEKEYGLNLASLERRAPVHNCGRTGFLSWHSKAPRDLSTIDIDFERYYDLTSDLPIRRRRALPPDERLLSLSVSQELRSQDGTADSESSAAKQLQLLAQHHGFPDSETLLSSSMRSGGRTGVTEEQLAARDFSDFITFQTAEDKLRPDDDSIPADERELSRPEQEEVFTSAFLDELPDLLKVLSWAQARRGGSRVNVDFHSHHPPHWTPLHVAARGGFLTICQCLVNEHGASVSVRDGAPTLQETPLISAASEGFPEVCNFLLLTDNFIVGDSDFRGMTALHHAAENGHLAVVKVLVDYHAPINARDRELGYTPLHRAIASLHTVNKPHDEVIAQVQLISYMSSLNGIDFHVRSLSGHTAYDLAIQIPFREKRAAVLKVIPPPVRATDDD
eukprot:gnl/Spiro4/26_TR16_c0_g1_i1.p1 gnl/Spiro4/26_TR16_c0_g1~~gnl/Spiro4/26_TR16_c0_g1_i1.p1  ORF type:complete len:496 (-),score=110.96 gnl/Spiro4/26_TR16_c0_g1_i1:41-1456(-)